MAGQWREALAQLKGYIAENPAIKISRNLTVIPADIREEFYRVFDGTRRTFLEEHTPEILEEARSLGAAYSKESIKLVERLGLAEIKLPARLKRVISDPVDGLSRSLFDPLFDLLKGKRSIEDFECEAENIVSDFWKPLFTQGYDDWIVLSLANMLAPDKVLAPSWSLIKQRCHELQPDEKRGWSEEHVPDAEEVSVIEIGHEGFDPAFIISDIILRAQNTGKYVSFGLDLTDSAWHAKNANERREWLPLRRRGFESKPLFNWPSIVIYIDDEPADISIVSDFSRFLRPDIMIECMKQDHWYQNGALVKILARHEFFKPTLGTFIISRYPVPDEISGILENINSTESADQQPEETETKAPSEISGDEANDSVFEQTPCCGTSPAALNGTIGLSPIRVIAINGYHPESLAPIVDKLSFPEVKETSTSVDYSPSEC